jgi:hypothetical protein
MEFEAPPPGAGLTTVMVGEPAAVRELAGTAAVRNAFETNVVASGLPFHRTADEDRKFEPTTLRVSAGPDCSLPLGEMAAIAGTGLGVPTFVGLLVEPPQPSRLAVAKMVKETGSASFDLDGIAGCHTLHAKSRQKPNFGRVYAVTSVCQLAG